MYLGGVKTTPILSTMTPRQRTILLTAAIFGLLGILLGTFGAHGIQQKVSAYEYKNYEKGVQYHYFFTLMMFVLGLLAGFLKEVKGIFVVFVFFVVGVILFSGSLYLIASAPVTGLNMPGFIFLVTPIGGFCFMIGWVWLIVSFFRVRVNQ